ncbi:nucleoporin Nup116 [Acrasis kona]|uniref:Nucleoporin Nup116 n=1 Tax=Acrasis kona TaxID=1008807 RepID=A0AAW2Z1J8_9EUKA
MPSGPESPESQKTVRSQPKSKATRKKQSIKENTKKRKGEGAPEKGKKQKKNVDYDENLLKFMKEQNQYFNEVDKTVLVNEDNVDDVVRIEEKSKQLIKEDEEQKPSTSTFNSLVDHSKLSTLEMRLKHPELYKEYLEYTKAVGDFLEPINFAEFLEQNGIYE